MIDGKGEGQPQTNAACDEALTDDTDHDDAGCSLRQWHKQQLVLQASNIDRQPSRRYNAKEYILITDSGEPKSYQEI